MKTLVWLLAGIFVVLSASSAWAKPGDAIPRREDDDSCMNCPEKGRQVMSSKAREGRQGRGKGDFNIPKEKKMKEKLHNEKRQNGNKNDIKDKKDKKDKMNKVDKKNKGEKGGKKDKNNERRTRFDRE